MAAGDRYLFTFTCNGVELVSGDWLASGEGTVEEDTIEAAEYFALSLVRSVFEGYMKGHLYDYEGALYLLECLRRRVAAEMTFIYDDVICGSGE